jgi:chromosome segregation ATPase
MVGSPPKQLSEALSLPGPQAAFSGLRFAVVWTTETLEAQLGQDDAAAIRCVQELAKALSELEKLFSLVPGLIELASPGGPVTERIVARQAELAAQYAQLAEERQALEALQEMEDSLRKGEHERSQLRAQIRDLERSQQLIQELPNLRGRLEELQAVTSDTQGRDGETVVADLSAAAQRLLELTENQRKLLDSESRALLSSIEAAETRLTRAHDDRDKRAAELATRLAEADELRHEQEETLPALQAHRQADAALADALSTAGLTTGESGIQRVRAALAEVETQLAAIDGLLRPLMAEHTRAYEEERQIRGWSV